MDLERSSDCDMGRPASALIPSSPGVSKWTSGARPIATWTGLAAAPAQLGEVQVDLGCPSDCDMHRRGAVRLRSQEGAVVVTHPRGILGAAMARSYYKDRSLGSTPPCAICGGPGERSL
jgi:hypothetical protein